MAQHDRHRGKALSGDCRRGRWAGSLVAICTLASVLFTPVTALADHGGRRLALLVGVGSFADPAINSLNYARNDVDAMEKWLTSPQGGGFAPKDVVVLQDERATRAAIVGQAQRLAKQAGSNDLVLIYFSTHGFSTTDQVVGMVSYDTRSTGRLDNRGGPIVPRDQALTRDDLYQILDGLAARRRVAIIDVCYSGQLAGEQAVSTGMGQGAIKLDAPESAAGQDTVTLVMASSLGSEPAWESQEFKASIFTHNLLRGLRKTGGDFLSAFNLARGETVRQSRLEKGIVQTPKLISQPPAGNLTLSNREMGRTIAGTGDPRNM